MEVLSKKLRRVIGITFSYKEFFAEFLEDLKTNTQVVAILDPTQEANLATLIDRYNNCGPSMGFSTKKYAYESLELVCNALAEDASIPEADKSALSSGILDVARYVGIAGEEDYHFQVATYNLSETISRIIGETVPIVPVQSTAFGGIVTFTVFDGGSGYTDGVGTSLELASTEVDDSVNAEVTLDIVSGSVVLGEYASDVVDVAGSGFYVGQVVTVEDPVNALGTPALAFVDSIV
jgi:hypothetical protein